MNAAFFLNIIIIFFFLLKEIMKTFCILGLLQVEDDQKQTKLLEKQN